MAPRAAKKTDSRLAARLAAIASLGAAVIHFAVVPTHWQEWMPSGLFFVSIALLQLIWALVVVARPTTAVLAAGIAANVGAAALWALSRTAGAPFGPNAGEPELVQAAGLCALLLEVYVVM
jgi:Na+/melibiose symporter-like transporter